MYYNISHILTIIYNVILYTHQSKYTLYIYIYPYIHIYICNVLGVFPSPCIYKADQWILLTRKHAQAILQLNKQLSQPLLSLFKRVSILYYIIISYCTFMSTSCYYVIVLCIYCIYIIYRIYIILDTWYSSHNTMYIFMYTIYFYCRCERLMKCFFHVA